MPSFLKNLSLLQITLLISVVLHAALLTVRFVAPEVLERVLQDTPLEVVLVNSSSKEKPVNAQVIAQRNLAGGGDAEQGRATSPLPPTMQTQVGDSLDDAQRQIDQMQQVQAQLLAQVKRDLAAIPRAKEGAQTGANQTPAEEEKRRHLTNLLAEIERRIQEENARPRRRYVSPAAREGVHALYYDELRRRIEDTGTRNFPEAAGERLYGELTVLVAVNHVGQVVEAEIVKGSGNRALDRQALAIVRNAAPYGLFTKAMKAQFDQLVFVSRFRFTRDEGLRANVEDAQARP